MRPTFLIIGAAKCGTTSLFQLLRTHPEIGMSAVKEPNFFSRDPEFQRGWEWYESLFAGHEAKVAVGEASHTYTKIGIYPHAVTRIVERLPEAKLLYIVRHPLVRMESGWAPRIQSCHTASAGFQHITAHGPVNRGVEPLLETDQRLP